MRLRYKCVSALQATHDMILTNKNAKSDHNMCPPLASPPFSLPSNTVMLRREKVSINRIVRGRLRCVSWLHTESGKDSPSSAFVVGFVSPSCDVTITLNVASKYRQVIVYVQTSDLEVCTCTGRDKL